MKQISDLLGAICLIALLLTACTPQAEPTYEEAPSTEGEVEAIKAFLDQYEAIAEEGDAETYFTLWAEDIVFMPPNEPMVEGKEAVKAWAQPLFDQFSMQETFSFAEIEVIGHWAFARGTYEYQATPKTEGEAIQQSGHIVYMLKRQPDGPWKIARVIYNIAPTK
jgi:uncharacterized protein (TIGR02246 family)